MRHRAGGHPDSPHNKLPAGVERLAAAQASTDESVQRLALAQASTDESVQRLALAQARTEESVQRLAQAQARTEERLDRLENAVARLATEVGELSTVVGGTVETDAEALLEWLAGERGWRFLEPSRPVELDGEIDVVATLTDGKRTFRILVEAKTRLRVADVERFGAKLPGMLAALAIAGPHLAYLYGLRVYPGVDAAAAAAGLGVLDSRGERVAPPGLAA
ncbi:MAG: hypothetical protein ACYDB7_10240 [Mycobacteriales bacterium]